MLLQRHSLLKQEEVGEDLVLAAADRVLIKEAIDEGRVIQNGRTLTLPED